MTMRNRLVASGLAVMLAVMNPTFGGVALAQDAREGIKVHGHWVIEVRNPDGSIASRREFENALTPEGTKQLAVLLTRQRTNLSFDRWAIYLHGTAWEQNHRYVVIAEPGYPGLPLAYPSELLSEAPPFLVHTLAVRGDVYVVLTGTATAASAGGIDAVGTVLEHGGHYHQLEEAYFSRATVPPLPGGDLVAGQIVQVTVTFSFS
jgi:hypothetical protein